MIGKHYRYTSIFCTEAMSGISDMESLLNQLKQGSDAQVVHSIFRAVHTLKGNASGMGFSAITELTHKMEDFFDVVRKGNVPVEPRAFEILHSCLLELREIILAIRDPSIHRENQNQIKGLVDQLQSEIDSAQRFFSRKVEPSPFAPEPSQVNNDQNFPKKAGPPDEVDKISLNKVTFVDIVSKLNNLVAHTAKFLGKNVNMEFRGEGIRIDPALLSVIDRVLIHLTRNAVVHGIEGIDQRRSAGKNDHGLVTISASVLENKIHIEVRDDGSGIDYGKVRQVASSKGMILLRDAESVHEDELNHFLFAPGFTTAESVTEISGRGVGMDVVRSELHSVGGSITIKNDPGKGASFTVSLPLSNI